MTKSTRLSSEQLRQNGFHELAFYQEQGGHAQTEAGTERPVNFAKIEAGSPVAHA